MKRGGKHATLSDILKGTRFFFHCSLASETGRETASFYSWHGGILQHPYSPPKNAQRRLFLFLFFLYQVKETDVEGLGELWRLEEA